MGNCMSDDVIVEETSENLADNETIRQEFNILSKINNEIYKLSEDSEVSGYAKFSRRRDLMVKQKMQANVISGIFFEMKMEINIDDIDALIKMMDDTKQDREESVAGACGQL